MGERGSELREEGRKLLLFCFSNLIFLRQVVVTCLNAGKCAAHFRLDLSGTLGSSDKPAIDVWSA